VRSNTYGIIEGTNTFVCQEGGQEKLMSQNQPEIQYAAFLAIDWADQKHVWSLQDANSGTCERGEVDQYAGGR